MQPEPQIRRKLEDDEGKSARGHSGEVLTRGGARQTRREATAVHLQDSSLLGRAGPRLQEPKRAAVPPCRRDAQPTKGPAIFTKNQGTILAISFSLKIA